MALVELKDVHHIYRVNNLETKALRGVDLEIKEREFTAIVGPSGSGKTTLLNITGGLDRPTSGEVVVAGRKLNDLSMGQLARFRLYNLGFIFQSYNLVEVLTARENAEFVLFLQKVATKERRRRATETLEAMGLGELVNRRPVEMSGGQQQRVAVARAVTARPKLVLADEPTANLDSKTGAELIELMLRMNEEYGTTFVLSSHDRTVIERARRVVTLHDGRVVGE